MNVVVTGAASSLGLVIAERFAREGAVVYALDSDAAALATLETPGVRGLPVDMLDPVEVERAFGGILAEAGAVDVLINNVGLGGPRAALEDVSLEDWNRTLAGSAGAAFLSARALIPAMKAQKSGAIINISTSSVVTGLPMRTPYIAAKAALEGLTRNLARELGPFNIRVNAIRPGPIDNERFARIMAGYAKERGMSVADAEASVLRYFSMRAKIALNEVADMVFFLASDAAPHVTGQCIAVDGNAEWEE